MVIRPDCISLTIHLFSVLLIVFSSIFLSFLSSKCVKLFQEGTLFLHTKNAVRITAQGHPYIKAEVNNGKITRPEEGGVFVVDPDTLGKLIMKIYDSDDTNNIKLLATNEYEVIKLPKMQPSISGKNSGNITKKEFFADSIIHVGNDDMLVPNYLEIRSFKVDIIRPGKDPVLDIPCDGNRISDKIKSIIKGSESGTEIHFGYIKTKGYYQVISDEVSEVLDDDGLPLAPMSFTLVDE